MTRIGAEPWRVGRKVGRTLYDANDNLIGVMDTPEMAAAVVQAMKERGQPWRHVDPSASASNSGKMRDMPQRPTRSRWATDLP